MKNKVIFILSIFLILLSAGLVHFAFKFGGVSLKSKDDKLSNLNAQIKAVEVNIDQAKAKKEDTEKEIEEINKSLELYKDDMEIGKDNFDNLDKLKISAVDSNNMGNFIKNYTNQSASMLRLMSSIYTGESKSDKTDLLIADLANLMLIENDINTPIFDLSSEIDKNMAFLEYVNDKKNPYIAFNIGKKILDDDFNIKDEILKELKGRLSGIMAKVLLLSSSSNRFDFDQAYGDKLLNLYNDYKDRLNQGRADESYYAFMEKLNLIYILKFDTLAREVENFSNLDLIDKTFVDGDSQYILRAFIGNEKHPYIIQEQRDKNKKTLTYYNLKGNPWYYIDFNKNEFDDLDINPSKAIDKYARGLFNQFVNVNK
ncbi:hypothetical protein LV469_02175 [Peptoniphilus sp. GNH]|nr:hypothetical protein HMPREF3189_00151 [Clostridiales bacterium KA00134]UHR03114.1 hypothetical protein LV469_02175 [Peptoniphilus sp. GNH]